MMLKIFLILSFGLLTMGCTSGGSLPFSTVLGDTDFEAASKKIAPPPLAEQSSDDSPQNSAESPGPGPGMMPLLGTEIFTFAGDEPGWYTVDDNVMGGVSSSTVAVVDPGLLSFTGNMSLENNGGFSSVRSDWTTMNLSDADGVLLRVLGDGKLYRLRIRTAETGRGISYNALFQTTPDSWKLVYIPFADMVPTYRGFLMDVDPLNPATIGSFGFMLSDKQPGEFSLTVDWIRAVSAEEMQMLTRSAIA